MADARLEDLRRTWLASGRIEDEVALLRERLRAGELVQAQLELASFCAHPAASALTNTPDHARPRSFDAWVRELEDAGHSTRVCALLGALRAPPVRLGQGRQRIDPAAREVLRAGEAWLRCPCPVCVEHVGKARGHARRALGRLGRLEAQRRADLILASQLAQLIAQGVARQILLAPTLRAFLGGCQTRLVVTQISAKDWSSDAARQLRRSAETRLWRAVQRYVAQWALGG